VGTANFRTKVITVIEALRPGEVVSYGDVAAQAGYAGAARAVGAVLRTSGDDGLPWWRVVMSTGRLAPGKEAEQGRRLRAEGVRVVNGRIAQPSRSPAPSRSYAGSQRFRVQPSSGSAPRAR
jgi:methylated-DNA-protein-cysteine methyltransferase-like protein